MKQVFEMMLQLSSPLSHRRNAIRCIGWTGHKQQQSSKTQQQHRAARLPNDENKEKDSVKF